MVSPTKSAQTLAADLARLDRETAALLATVHGFDAADLLAPSRCEGWSRAHVVAHLVSNADGLGNLVRWAVSGIETPMYPSQQARDEAIEHGARQDPDTLRAELRRAVRGFHVMAEQLNSPLGAQVVSLRGRALSSYALVARRITEVIVHHADLLTSWTLDHAEPESLADAIDGALARLDGVGGAPGLRITTEDGGSWVLGDGATSVHGPAAAVLAWLARGELAGLTLADPAPVLPSW